MLQDFIASIEAQGLRIRGIEVYQRGQKVAEHRWEADLRYSVHSVSKSFTSAAVGIAVGEGLLDVNERVVDIFPECVPEQEMSSWMPDSGSKRAFSVWPLVMVNRCQTLSSSR